MSSGSKVYRRPLLSDVVKSDDGNAAGSGNTLLGANGSKRGSASALQKLRKACGKYDGMYYRQLKALARWYLDYAHATFRVRFDDVVIVTTIYVLVADSIRQLWAPVSADIYFTVCTSFCFFLFALELVVTSWCKSDISLPPTSGNADKDIPTSPTGKQPPSPKSGPVGLPGGKTASSPRNVPQQSKIRSMFMWPLRIRVEGFLLSFWFWLDLISLLSLIVDLPWMMPNEWERNKRGNLWRVLRMVRLVRLVRLYKIASHRTRESRIIEELQDLVDKGLMTESEVEEKISFNRLMHRQSKVGGELSNSIMKRVILGVFLMLCIVPLLVVNTVDEVDAYGTEMLQSYNVLGDQDALAIATESFIEMLGTANSGNPSLLYLEFEPDDRVIVDISRRNFRSYELYEYVFSDVKDGVVYSTFTIFSERQMFNNLAAYDLMMIAFIALMLGLGVVLLNNDARRLVLAPIERMMEIIEYVALDPLQEDQQVLLSEGADRTGEYEMKLLETAITKITGLLRVGFGVAGAEIISKNLRIDDSSSSVLDPMIPGKRVYSIYGFCDIHRFEFITESLREEVMTFINTVAAMVHASTCAWDGECNKNLGNSFLLVWRIGDAEEVLLATQVARIDAKKAPSSPSSHQGRNSALSSSISPKKGEGGERPSLVRRQSINLQRVPGVDTLADKALISFIKCIHEISTNSKIRAYENHPQLRKGSPNGFKLSMGFGLHTGWSIEGAVGSQQKVDATYLSPHVNMTARMETASRQYGVMILLTDDFFKLLSKAGQSVVRKLDVVTVKGSQVPMPIYTYDTHVTDDLKPRIDEANIEEDMEEESYNYNSMIWYDDAQLLHLRRLCTKEFLAVFNQGVKDYLGGNWEQAKTALKQADEIKISLGCKSGDGPSRTLLEYMGNRNNTAPSDWKGCRELNSK